MNKSDEIQNQISIRLASEDDLGDLYEWRNDDETRKNSLNSEFIEYHQHLNWFKSFQEDNRGSIFIAESTSDKIGTVRFENRNSQIECSWMLSPKFRGKGLAAPILTQALATYNCNCICKIKKQNVASIRISEKCGFKLKTTDNDILIFEYKAQH